MRVYTAVFLLVILSHLSCKKELPLLPAAATPCDSQLEVNANFRIERPYISVFTDGYVFMETDTFLSSPRVRFSSEVDDALSYKWIFQNDTLQGKFIELNLAPNFSGYTVDITSIIEKDPNSYCFPNDDGFDTLTKQMYISYLPLYSADGDTIFYGTEGVYRVEHPETKDSIEIEIVYRDKGNLIEDYVQIKNFDGEGTLSLDSSKAIRSPSFRRVDFAMGNPQIYSQSISGTIYNDINGVAHLTFESNFLSDPQEGTVDYKKWEYHGRKIK